MSSSLGSSAATTSPGFVERVASGSKGRPDTQRGLTYFEQHGAYKPQSDHSFTLGTPGGSTGSRPSVLGRSFSSGSVPQGNPRLPSFVPKSHLDPVKRQLRSAPPPIYDPRAISLASSLAAAITGDDELLVSTEDLRRSTPSARPISALIQPEPGPSTYSFPSRQQAVRASSFRTPDGPHSSSGPSTRVSETGEERRQRKQRQKDKRQEARETERTRIWTEETAKYQNGKRPEQTAGSSKGPGRHEPVRRDELGFVSTEFMDSFISELNPEAKGLKEIVARPSPWQPYEVPSSSRNRNLPRRSKVPTSGGVRLSAAGSSVTSTGTEDSAPRHELIVPAPVSRQASVRSTSSSTSAAPSITDIVRTHSPALLSASVSPRTQIPSIDEIIKKHAGATRAAHNAVRKSLARSQPPSPYSKSTASPPTRTSSHTTAVVNVVPPRTSSLNHEDPRRVSSDSMDSDVEATQALLEKLAADEENVIASPERVSLSTPRRSASLQRSPTRRSHPPSTISSARRPTPHVESHPPAQSPTPSDPATYSLALYLRSPRLTRMIAVPGSPPLNVSLADLGSSDGKVVLVFLGLGSVRYLVALFDELAEALGLRLICIDRWGLGKTDNVSQDRRGLLEWARVVEHVIDVLNIDRFSVLAHSAGAPYALATAMRLGERIDGPIHLLSPWVSSDVDGGYKWLKWVPNSMIKSAQAAEWHLQGWALGKPPPLTYNPIGFDASAPIMVGSEVDESFDDLTDFDGRFQGESPLPLPSVKLPILGKKVSSAFRGGFRTSPRSSSSMPPATLNQRPSSDDVFERTAQRATSYCSGTVRSHRGEVGLSDTSETLASDLNTSLHKSFSVSSRSSVQTDRSHKRNQHLPPSPALSHDLNGPTFGTALLQASHAESLLGGTADLMAILGRDTRPWGFSYTDVKQPCKIWYGTEDDKISEKSMRWCERCMDAELLIVSGEGHNLMTSSRVMLEVFESLASARDAGTK